MVVSSHSTIPGGEDVFIKHGFPGEYFVGTISDAEENILAVFEVRKERMTLSPKRMDPSLCVGVYQDLVVLLFDAPSSLKVLQAYNSQKCSMARERTGRQRGYHSAGG